MKRILFAIAYFLISSTAHAQWAVYDHEVKEILEKINRVANIADKKVTALELKEHSLLSEKFETQAPTDALKYIGTAADCGDDKLNPNHYNACLGLRNLRLKTLEQTEAIITKLETRRTEIKSLVEASRSGIADTDAGQLQRYQFELQGMQAHMQNDAMQLVALRDGYSQREKMYEMQMAEARRATDTRPPAIVELGAMPFIKPPKAMR